MFESLAVEVLLSLTIGAVSALAVAGIVRALMATWDQEQDDLDIDGLVQSAPFQRLHNVVNLDNDS